tara:strand:+ start:211 stop:714 length:504 start_codon:yes stop_codon:yes gene_type:complete
MTTLDQLLEPTKPVSKSTIESRSAPVSFSPVTRVNGSEAERGGKKKKKKDNNDHDHDDHNNDDHNNDHNRDSSGRLVKGHGAGGRPKGVKNKMTAIATAVLSDSTGAIVKRCVELALEGDPASMKICMDRIMPVGRGTKLAGGEGISVNIIVDQIKDIEGSVLEEAV